MKRVGNLERIFGCLVLLLAVLVVNSQAQDTDNDGFAETAGITTLGTSPINVPLCPAESTNDGAFCMRALGPDIFVILAPAAGGRLGALSDPLQVIRNLDRPAPAATTGVHQLTPAQVSSARQISPTATSAQKAIRVTENLGKKTDGTKGTNPYGLWGSSTKQGTPNTFGGGEAKVFTAQIAADITAHHAPAAVPAGKIEDCIRHTIAHEVGHNLVIAAQADPALTGSHYSTTQGVVMSQAPVFIKSGGVVDVICPTLFAAPDHTGFRLK